MATYKCTSCDIVFTGDQWHNKCPQCGNLCWENDEEGIEYLCRSCDIVFTGDRWHNKCPKCGNMCWEN